MRKIETIIKDIESLTHTKCSIFPSENSGAGYDIYFFEDYNGWNDCWQFAPNLLGMYGVSNPDEYYPEEAEKLFSELICVLNHKLICDDQEHPKTYILADGKVIDTYLEKTTYNSPNYSLRYIVEGRYRQLLYKLETFTTSNSEHNVKTYLGKIVSCK